MTSLNAFQNRSFDPYAFTEQAARVGLPRPVAKQALFNLRHDRVLFLGVSGKMGAGKDSAAPAVLGSLGVPSYERLFFSKALKEEVNRMLDVLRGTPREAAGAVIAETMDVPYGQATHLVGLLAVMLAADPDTTAYGRSQEHRAALQFHGTNVRRAQNDDYWVHQTLLEGIPLLADGHNVLFTDCRFPNEVEGSQTAGATVARLDVTEETQRARIFARDGIYPTRETLMHPSETALDDYRGFDLRLSNDGAFAGTVAQIVEHLTPTQTVATAA